MFFYVHQFLICLSLLSLKQDFLLFARDPSLQLKQHLGSQLLLNLESRALQLTLTHFLLSYFLLTHVLHRHHITASAIMAEKAVGGVEILIATMKKE